MIQPIVLSIGCVRLMDYITPLSYFSSPSINTSVGICIKMHVSPQHALVLAIFTMDSILSDLN